MAEPTRDPQAGKPRTGDDKKQPETVLLTAEELKAIAGGGGVVKPPTDPITTVSGKTVPGTSTISGA